MTDRPIVYAAHGRLLEVLDLDPGSGTLALLQSIEMPETVQYATADHARSVLYVATSGGGPMNPVKRQAHFIEAFAIASSGRLTLLAPPQALEHRPLDLTLDPGEHHLLIVYNDPSGITVHPLLQGGVPGHALPRQPLALGPTAHQIRISPKGRLALVPACGHHPTGLVAGSLGVFAYDNGQLTPLGRVVGDPGRSGEWRGLRNGGQGFAARQVVFHPTRPWVYLCLEAQCEVHQYGFSEQGLSEEPLSICSTLEGGRPAWPAQLAGAIRLHPSGRHLYVSNRSRDTVTFAGQQVSAGGVNGMAVLEIDPSNGMPRLIQQVDSHGFFPRTFGIDAGGRMMVVANQESGYLRAGSDIRRIIPGLAVFAIGNDGKLTFRTQREYPDDGMECFWADILERSEAET